MDKNYKNILVPIKFDKLTCVDKYSLYVVFGYIRTFEKSSLSTQIIPSLISHICLLYFYQQNDFWKKVDKSKMDITNDNRTIKKREKFESYVDCVLYITDCI